MAVAPGPVGDPQPDAGTSAVGDAASEPVASSGQDGPGDRGELGELREQGEPGGRRDSSEPGSRRVQGGPSELTEGYRLFARYAHAPNALGYCGPAAADALRQVACGHGDPSVVPELARGFSGAWPYQALLAQVVGGLDPLSPEIGRAYWTGSELSAGVDGPAFGERLLDHIGARAGHYWRHLTPDLVAETAPTHAFHVLGIYPWSRLLTTGMPEPLHVLDSCRIRVGRVLEVADDALVVDVDRLTFEDGNLAIGDSSPERVDYRSEDGTFVGEPAVGEFVAVHWGFACDHLTPQERDDLLASTARQVDFTAARLRREAGGG